MKKLVPKLQNIAYAGQIKGFYWAYDVTYDKLTHSILGMIRIQNLAKYGVLIIQ